MDYYICPSCKAKNDEHRKYCDNCGTWLLSTAYPAKKIKIKRKSGPIINVVALLVIAAVIYFGLTSSSPERRTTIDQIKIGDQYTISQLTVSNHSIAADFTAHVRTTDPLEVKASFYDGSGNRLGIATSLIGQQLSKDQTTTISFKLDGIANGAKSVRVEVVPMSPLMLMDRVTNK